MTIGERIRSRRKEIGKSVDQIADELGKNRATVYRYESSDIKKMPLDVLEPLARVLHTTPGYLMGWTEDPADIGNDAAIPDGFIPVPDMVSVPLIGSIACGTPILAEENIKQYIGIPAAWRADFALECHGDSMAPKICDGDIVCIRKQSEVETGQIAAVRIGEEATLKHFYRQGDVVQLIAENSAACPPMVYSGRQLAEIQIEGLAVGFCRGLV